MKISNKFELSPKQLLIVWYAVAFIAISVIAYFAYLIGTLQQKNLLLQEDLRLLQIGQAETAKKLSDTIAIIDKNLNLTKSEQEELRGKLAQEQERVAAQQRHLDEVAGTVGTLEKLTYTDEELLQKYSKVFFLNEHFIPANLSKIPAGLVHSSKNDIQIHSTVLKYLENMLRDNNDPDFDLQVISAYRSFDTQQNLKNQYTVTYGAGTANQFSADQGYSEHQLGTTVDFTTIRTGTDLSAFEETSDYQWLTQNAHRYGFTLSYPEGNDYYISEPWHWRFVGVALATKLYNEGKHFYDLEQREIDQFLVNIFD
ncbi:MAG: M15 family metallopeptidase [bacterium]|nr:M15 family metallopeptidase [bacterium]